MTAMFLDDLSLPFPSSAVRFRIGAVNQDRTSGQALAYVDARAIQQRFDEVVGKENWKVSFRVERPYGDERRASVICCISVRVNGEWVGKEDGCQIDEVPLDSGDQKKDAKALEIAIKGAYSDAEKRAAVQWGVGRYLYGCKPGWVALKRDGKEFAEQPCLGPDRLPRIFDLVCVRRGLRHAAAAAEAGGVNRDDLVGEVLPILGEYSNDDRVTGVVTRCVDEILTRTQAGRISDVIAFCRRLPKGKAADLGAAPDGGETFVTTPTEIAPANAGSAQAIGSLASLAIAQIAGMSREDVDRFRESACARFPGGSDREAVLHALSRRDAELLRGGPTQGSAPVTSGSASPTFRTEAAKCASTVLEEEERVQAAFASIIRVREPGVLDGYDQMVERIFVRSDSRIRVRAAIGRRRMELEMRAGVRAGGCSEVVVQ